MPPCHTGEEAYGKKDDVLLVVQKEGIDRFHFAKLIPLLRNGERKEAPVRCGWTAIAERSLVLGRSRSGQRGEQNECA